MTKKKILYCFAGHSVFGYRDIEMFSKEYDIKGVHYDLHTKILLKVFSFIKYNAAVLTSIINKNIIIINFGAWHTILPVFLAKLLGKKSFIIVGGFDVGNIPSLNYGIFHKKSLLQWYLKRTYRRCTFICPTSQALTGYINKYADPNGKGYPVGLLVHMPELRDKIYVIPRTIDIDFWNIAPKKAMGGILSIAYIYHEQTLIVKGFDLIIECAKLLPDIPFTLAGFSPSMLTKYRKICPENVHLLGFQTKESARVLYQTHKVYLMPSMTEGLGQALCEAMLCGCFPIGSRVGIIADLIKNDRFILDHKDKYTLKECIEIALESDVSPNIWRQNIIDYFKDINRLEKFKDLIEKS